jgi:hypothetical protein
MWDISILKEWKTIIGHVTNTHDKWSIPNGLRLTEGGLCGNKGSPAFG